MTQIDLSRYAPPGTNIRQEIKVFCVGLFCAACCAVLVYGIALCQAYADLFEPFYSGVERVLRPDAVMLPFDDVLLHRGLWLFYLLALCALANAVLLHLSYYTGGSKSIYLMRRLPQRWELVRRAITLPLLGAAICLLSALALRLLFLGVYYLITPPQCLP